MVPPNQLIRTEEFAPGSTAVLQCISSDNRHSFMFWQLGQNIIIGPGNEYDHHKYKYNVLSGKLHIKNVMPEEAGFYRCVSKDLNSDGLSVGAINMVVSKLGAQPTETGTDLQTIKIIFIIISLIVLVICGILFYRMRKEDKKAKSKQLAVFGDEDDEEGSGDEIYNRTTTVINNTIPTPGPSTSKDHITGIDNRGLDTDFNSAFEQIAINVANRNLI